jgi:type I restriction enzyme S subunit
MCLQRPILKVFHLLNDNLERIAKTIYDYWFVQFDFPDVNGKHYKSSGGKMVWNEELKRKIPAGWEVKKLGDYALIKKEY